jgi:cell division protein ZapB
MTRLYSNSNILPSVCIAMTDDQFNTLDEKITALIALCAAMKQENQLLRAGQHNWQSERQQLLENNRQAKARLESVLTRLRSMELSSST